MNTQIFYFFYNLAHHSNFFDSVVVFFAVYFPLVVCVLAGVFLLIHHEVFSAERTFLQLSKKWQEIALVFLTSGFAWVCAKVLKTLIHTSRPFIALPGVHPLFIESGFAFPSGHATFFMALAFALFFTHKKLGYIFMIFAFIIGIARVTAGVHFPGDILGGFILGAGIAYLVAFWTKNI